MTIYPPVDKSNFINKPFYLTDTAFRKDSIQNHCDVTHLREQEKGHVDEKHNGVENVDKLPFKTGF